MIKSGTDQAKSDNGSGPLSFRTRYNIGGYSTSSSVLRYKVMADTESKVDPEGSSQENEQLMAILSSEFGQGFVCTMGYECRHRDPYSQPEGG